MPNGANSCWSFRKTSSLRRPNTYAGSALHVMLFLEHPVRTLCIFKGVWSCHCQRALLGYHYRVVFFSTVSRAGTYDPRVAVGSEAQDFTRSVVPPPSGHRLADRVPDGP